MKAKFFYENQFEEICVLKTTKIKQLLKNANLSTKLNLNRDSLHDYVLARGKNPDQRLSNEDTHKSIGEFLTDQEQLIEFHIALLVHISTLSNHEKPEEVPLFTGKITIEELFQLFKGSERGYKNLASCQTKKIIDFHQSLSNVSETRFLLVKEDQSCCIHIRRSTKDQSISIDDDERIIKESFVFTATVGDIYKSMHINDQNKYLLLEKNFLPSLETPLSLFISTSPIEFDLSDEKLPIHITVKNSTDEQTINYHSLITTQFDRLCSIACRLMNLNEKFYQLKYNEIALSDGKMSLEDLDIPSNEVRFELICISPLKASIKFQQTNIFIPCTEETLVSELVEEALLKLKLSKSDSHQFDLLALDVEKTQIDMDYKIEDVCILFPGNTGTLELEIRKKS